MDEAAKAALAPFERGAAGENPFAVQSELQDFMQDLVGIVRVEGEMQQALEKIKGLRARAAKAGITGNREYNTGWHTALDLDNMLVISEMIAMAALERKESRGGALPRRLSRQERRMGQIQFAHQQRAPTDSPNWSASR